MLVLFRLSMLIYQEPFYKDSCRSKAADRTKWNPVISWNVHLENDTSNKIFLDNSERNRGEVFVSSVSEKWLHHFSTIISLHGFLHPHFGCAPPDGGSALDPCCNGYQAVPPERRVLCYRGFWNSVPPLWPAGGGAHQPGVEGATAGCPGLRRRP